MKSPIIEKIETLVIMAMNGAGVEQKEAELQARVVAPMIEELFHSFALELAEGTENMKSKEYSYTHTFPNDMGVLNTEGEVDWNIKSGDKVDLKHPLTEEELIRNEALSHAATFIREAVKTDE